MKFNLDKLTKVLKADTSDMLNNPKKYWNFKFQKGKGYLYVDRGANILAVAHMDTVADPNKYTKNKSNFRNDVSIEKVGFDDYEITSIKLDDRLGVFMIMDVLPYLGLRYDILLTTDEEIGMSSAMYFRTSKKYNWMFELDRRDYGTAVLYQYQEKEIVDALKVCSYKIETGSFSDIANLDFLGCSGVNFGVGYLYEHTEGCYTRTSWMNVVVNMFVDFYNFFKDTRFDYVYKPTYLKSWQKIGGRIPYEDYYYDDDWYDSKYDNAVYNAKTDKWEQKNVENDPNFDLENNPNWVYDEVENRYYFLDDPTLTIEEIRRFIGNEKVKDNELDDFDLLDNEKDLSPKDFLYPGDHFEDEEAWNITTKKQ